MNPETGIIFRIKKYALHDGPGIRTTVFLKGCPLRCRWCHNPEGLATGPQVMHPPEGSCAPAETLGCEKTVSSVMAAVETDTLFYDESGGGVTFSGGEPLMQAPFLASLLAGCRARDIHTAVDTSGYAPADTFAGILAMADLILFDLKIMDDAAHREFTGVSNRRIRDNLKMLAASGTPFRVRVPLVPDVTDTDANIGRMTGFLNALGVPVSVDLLPYHRIAGGKYRRLGMPDPMSTVKPPSSGRIGEIVRRFDACGIPTTLGG